MNALMLAMQALVDPGDVVVTTTPSWPNLPAVPLILSGELRNVPLSPGNLGWRIDLDRLFDACDGRTRVIFPQFAQQPDRLDVGRAEGARIRTRARHLDRERRSLCTHRL
jgi:aspartate/methionine/tyrosine aminotransferase